ncbi:MAG: ribose 5-phosphate isomerase B [Desulfonatronovibrionaceae bacterium]
MKKPLLFFGSDHAGIHLKIKLIGLLEEDFQCIDVGTRDAASCDYPIYAFELGRQVLKHDAQGILICGSGIGMSMTANRIKGIRAALCLNEYMARMSRMHNKANVLCLGERIVGPGLAESIARVFLGTGFEGGRHERRIHLMDEQE